MSVWEINRIHASTLTGNVVQPVKPKWQSWVDKTPPGQRGDRRSRCWLLPAGCWRWWRRLTSRGADKPCAVLPTARWWKSGQRGTRPRGSLQTTNTEFQLLHPRKKTPLFKALLTQDMVLLFSSSGQPFSCSTWMRVPGLLWLHPGIRRPPEGCFQGFGRYEGQKKSSSTNQVVGRAQMTSKNMLNFGEWKSSW